jgi:serine/threonine-protein kinase RsbW/sigma-B regulation protein RsbU (phosphoserine phosphatase)
MADSSSATGGQTRVFPARLEILPETAAFVEAFCAGHAVGRDAALRLVLIVEELAANTVLHGHRGESDGSITIMLTRGIRDVALFYEDTAPPYDPIPALAQSRAPLDTPLEARPLGQLGLRLVGQFAAAVRYAREAGRNRLWLSVDCTD